MRRFRSRIKRNPRPTVGADCSDPAITPRALPLLPGSYPAALERLATSGQLTTFHQASM